MCPADQECSFNTIENTPSSALTRESDLGYFISHLHLSVLVDMINFIDKLSGATRFIFWLKLSK